MLKMNENYVLTFMILLNTLKSITFVYADEEDDIEYEKLKEFKKYIGQPNIFLDEENDLVLKVSIYSGMENRIIDSGIAAVGVQLKENTNAELINYLSKVLEIGHSYFFIYPGDQPNKRIVKIKGNPGMPYEVVDKLIAALEITAKEEPDALKKAYPLEDDHILEETPVEDVTRIFDWRGVL